MSCLTIIDGPPHWHSNKPYLKTLNVCNFCLMLSRTFYHLLNVVTSWSALPSDEGLLEAILCFLTVFEVVCIAAKLSGAILQCS